MKKSISVILALVIMLGLAACGSTSNNSPTSSSSSTPNSDAGASTQGNSENKEPVELRFAWWGNADRSKLYNEILDMYEAENQHVKIVREAAGFGDYWPKLATQAASGSLPDVFGLHVLLYGGEYGSRNVLEPLEPFVESGLINLDGWDQSVIDAGKINNVLYAVPKGITINGLIANVSMIKEAGMEPPKNGISYDEFVQYLTELQSKLPKGKYGMIDPSYDDHMFETFMRQKGKSVLKPDGSAIGFDKEDLVEFWTIWENLRKSGVLPPVQLTAEHTGVPSENTLFVKEQAAIDVKPANHGKIYSRYLEGKELALIRWPIMPNGKFLGGENLQAPSMVISNKSKNKEEAAKLINWFVNNVEAQKIYNLENGIPGSKAIQEALRPGLHPMDVQAIDHMAAVTKDIPPTDYRPQGAAQVFTTYKSYLDQLAFGKLSVEKAVDGFFSEVEGFLKK